MALLRKPSKKEQTVLARRKRRSSEEQANSQMTKSRRIGYTVILLGLSALIILVCFLGQSPAGPQIFPNQVAKIRVVADFPFSYESEIKTEHLREQRRQMTAPVYRVDIRPYNEFSQVMVSLNQKIDQLELHLETLPREDRANAIAQFTLQFGNNNGINLNPEDIQLLLNKANSKKRDQYFSESLIALRDTLRSGVYDKKEGGLYGLNQENYFFTVDTGSKVTKPRYKSIEDALRFLRINISALDVNSKTAIALFHIFKSGIQPNLEYDAIKSNEKIEEALGSLEPVYVTVNKGQTIIEPGSVITKDAYEQLNAYREKNRTYNTGKVNLMLLQRMLATFIIILGSFLYFKLECVSSIESKRHKVLPIVLILFNLGLIRLILKLDETQLFIDYPALIASLPYMAPVVIAPMLTTLLISSTAAILVTMIMCAFNALMHGSDVTYFFIYLLASLMAIYFSKNIYIRAKVFQASLISGLTIAISGVAVNALNLIEINTLGVQFSAAIVTGVLSGVVVVGLRPLLENLFKITTNFTLLELTDFNHPLLRKMQVEAPGTYHHSLMVANLSERAASEIGANPLLCRVCALFHDIGKLSKPEYFVENQREGYNPHDEKNPSMSALIIRNHVKEGLEMAEEYALPKPIRDVIEQHHGNSLIQYFYNKALIQARAQVENESEEDNKTLPAISIDEANYRYEGVIPDFKESAIIAFADCTEAACRSLKKVTPQNIEELIESIFRGRIHDHQMDDAPLTLEELNIIKSSFASTVLNMLHNRIEYPSINKEDSRD